MIKQQQWADWLASPVTQAVIQHLDSQKTNLIQQLLDIPISNGIEAIGLDHLAIRYKLDGLGEFLDVESLSENIIEVSNED